MKADKAKEIEEIKPIDLSLSEPIKRFIELQKLAQDDYKKYLDESNEAIRKSIQID